MAKAKKELAGFQFDIGLAEIVRSKRTVADAVLECDLGQPVSHAVKRTMDLESD